MSNVTVAALIALIVIGVATLIGLGVRTWLRSYFEGAVAHQSGKELEAVRSDLHIKESEIAALQSNALSGPIGKTVTA